MRLLFVFRKYHMQDAGFIIYLTSDAVIWQDGLPKGLVYNSSEKTLRSETGKVGRSVGGLSGKVEGGPFSIGSRLVTKITDLKGNLLLENR